MRLAALPARCRRSDRAAHLRPLSVSHLSAKSIGLETELSWIPRNLDDADGVDPTAQVQIRWGGGEMTVSGTQAILPIEGGSNTPVTLTPMDPIGGAGLSKVIYI